MYEKRILARKMRREGSTITEIKNTLGVSKSTASLWCRDIVLSEKQKKTIIENSFQKTTKGRMMGAEMNKQKRLEAIIDAERYGLNIIKKVNQRELLIIGTALYWAEGSKSDATFGFQFINSNPDMILCMKKFLRAVEVNDDDICCSIQINEIHKPRISTVLNFWKKLLRLSDEQIGNPSFVKTKINKIYENYDSYFGICRLRVRKSTLLKYKMIGLIKALKNDILLPR